MPPSKIPTIASGPSRHVYDVIVLGGQLGGALTAALLAKRSYRVLLVEHDGMGPGYEHDGFLLPYAPFVAPPLKTIPAAEEAFTELGITTTVQRAVKTHVPELQLVLPNARADLPHEEPRRLSELTREFGDEAPRILETLKAAAAYHEQTDAFFKDPGELPAEGMFESWGLKNAVKKVPGLQAEPPAINGNDAGKLLAGLLPFVTHLDAPTAPVARGRPLSQLLAGPSRYPGGREGIRELLTKRFTDLGGDMLAQGSDSFIAEELSFEGDKLVGVKLLKSDTIYRASIVVGATDAGALRRLITDKKRHRKLLEQLDLSATKRFLFTVNWVVPANLLPRGMGELLLMQTDSDLSPMLIQVGPARRPGKADDEGARTVCAGAYVPASARELGEEHLQAIAERMHQALEQLMPFVRKKALSVSATYLDAGGVRGSRLLPHPLLAIESESIVGVEGLPQRTPVKNLVLANREVLPGLGLEGELLAGIRAARLVGDLMKKKDPLKR